MHRVSGRETLSLLKQLFSECGLQFTVPYALRAVFYLFLDYSCREADRKYSADVFLLKTLLETSTFHCYQCRSPFVAQAE